MIDATTDAESRGARAALAECVVVAAIVFVVYAVSRPDAVATLGRLYDDVVYLSVGKSIADGLGYRSAQLVGTPVHAKFPPLLPALYAIGWMVFGTLAAVARLALWVNIIVVAASAGALWWLARRELQLGRAATTLFVVVPIVTDRAMFYFSGAASEPWMLFGWTVALILVRRLTRATAVGAPAIGLAVALGLTLAATALARTQGVAIAAAVLGGVALSRVGRRTTAVAAVTTAAPLIAWSLWHGAMLARGPVSPLPDQRSYLAWIPMSGIGELSTFAAKMARISVPLYWSSAADVIVGWTSSKTLLLAALILICGVVGTVVVARRFPALAASNIAILGVLAIWPYVQDRFLTPVLPMLGVAGAFVIDRTVARLPRLLHRGALAAMTLLAIVLLAENARMRIDSVRGAPRSPYAHAIDDIVRWVDRNTTPTDHLMVEWGGAVFLRTGRRTSIPNPEEPTLGASVLDAPFRFYATRILADSVDDVIIWDRAPGRAAAWLRALATRCPGVLTETGRDSTTSRPQSDVHFYRVRRDLPCLVENANASAAGTNNKNAPRGAFSIPAEVTPPRRRRLQGSSLLEGLRTAHQAFGDP